MIVNKMRTLTRFTAVIVFAMLFAAFCAALKVSAFSDILHEDGTSATNSQTDGQISPFESAEKILCGAGPVNVTLVNHGEVSTYKFFPVECSAFLQYEGIELGVNDVMNVTPDTMLYDNIIVDIGSVEFVQETRSDIIPFDVVECEVGTIPKGTRRVTQKGQNGEALRTYIVKYVNGVATDEVLYSENPVSLPVEEIAEMGVGGVVTSPSGESYNYSYYIPMEATAYTYMPGYTTMTTATGATLKKGIAAVDPSVVPLHTKMYVSGSSEYGYCEAEDTGGAIKGNKIDLAFMSYDECIQFGRRNVVVYILE